MILLRLSPLVPFNVLGYISGGTVISFSNYSVALLGMLPGVILYCAIGVSGCSVAMNYNSPYHIVAIVLGLGFAILGLVITSHYAKKELKKIVAIEANIESEHNNLDENERCCVEHEATSLESKQVSLSKRTSQETVYSSDLSIHLA